MCNIKNVYRHGFWGKKEEEQQQEQEEEAGYLVPKDMVAR